MNPCTDSIEQVTSAGRELKRVYLYPGQLFVSGEPALVTTILGSCIAVCLWDSVSEIGGINHYLLPLNPLRGQDDARYGSTAIDQLVEQMTLRGAVTSRLVAKVVGGASIMSRFSDARLSIGEQNSGAAREALDRLSIPIAAEQTGGRRGRKLLFHTGNGCAFSKEI